MTLGSVCHNSLSGQERWCESPLSLLFSRLNSPSSLSRSSSDLFSSPSPASLPFSGHTPAPQCPVCSEGPRAEHSTRGAASPAPVQGPNPCPAPAGHTIADKPEHRWPSWPSGHFSFNTDRTPVETLAGSQDMKQQYILIKGNQLLHQRSCLKVFHPFWKVSETQVKSAYFTAKVIQKCP